MNVRLETRTRLQLPFDADDFGVLLFEDAMILPRRNQRDVEDVPEELRGVFVNDADGVLRQALTPAVTRVRPAA